MSTKIGSTLRQGNCRDPHSNLNDVPSHSLIFVRKTLFCMTNAFLLTSKINDLACAKKV